LQARSDGIDGRGELDENLVLAALREPSEDPARHSERADESASRSGDHWDARESKEHDDRADRAGDRTRYPECPWRDVEPRPLESQPQGQFSPRLLPILDFLQSLGDGFPAVRRLLRLARARGPLGPALDDFVPPFFDLLLSREIRKQQAEYDRADGDGDQHQNTQLRELVTEHAYAPSGLPCSSLTSAAASAAARRCCSP